MLARLRPRLASALRRPPLVVALHPLPPLPPARASCRLLSRRARPPERPVERRKGPDGQWYSSQAVFRMAHPRADWESAEVERRREKWVQDYLGTDDYEFGDLTKKAVQNFTGKDEYEFGDISKKLFGDMKKMFGQK